MRTALSVSEFNNLNGGPGTFERLLRILHGVYANVPQRRVESGGQVIEARNVDGANPGTTLLHIVAYTPDEQMPGVPNAARNASSAGLILLEAPDDVEFLDGQLMALVRENDVLLCKDGLGEAALVAYVLGLARQNGMDTASLAFHLMKRADIDKIEMIRRDGIKSVSMNAVAHQTSVDHVERHNVRERIAEVKRQAIRAKLIQQKWMFYLYLITLSMIFGCTILGKHWPLVTDVVERVYFGFATTAFLLSFRLPAVLMEVQMDRVEAVVGARRQNASQLDRS